MVTGRHLKVHVSRCSRCQARIESVTLDDGSIIRLDLVPQRAMMRPHGTEVVQVQVVHACSRGG